MARLGTREKLIEETGTFAIHWRKPLAIAEVNQMAPTPDVRRREGRA